MQALVNKPGLPNLRNRDDKRKARQKSVRQPDESGTTSAAVISDGIFAVKLVAKHALDVAETMKDPDDRLEHVFEDLYPAYCRFMTLLGNKPKVFENTKYAPGLMLQDLIEYFGDQVYQEEMTIDAFTKQEYALDRPTENYEHKFVLRKRLPARQHYNVFFYRCVALMLWKNGKRAYYHLFHKILKSLSKMYVSLWSDIQDYPLEWLEERNHEETEHEDIQANKKMAAEYEEGKAHIAEMRILKYGPLDQSDIDNIHKNLDPEHPISKMAIELYELLMTGKNINMYADVLDDEFYGLRFDCQFQIFYDPDWLYDMYQEFIDNDAGEGVQEPTLFITLSADMEALQLDDDFPKRLTEFFYVYGDIEDQITKYLKSNEEHNSNPKR
ncbi:MAG: hypothetical protein EOP49_17765 [Sphingobacteriales bacterium]|nr:MAG: hypothetical protein EOP49_17765 [Sphingobacteriales bacterium]